MEVITEKTKRKHMPYCDHGRENLCFDLFKLNRRFEHITHKKAVVVEISILRIIQCRKGRGVMVYKDSFMGEFRLTWGNIGWMPEILDFKTFCRSLL